MGQHLEKHRTIMVHTTKRSHKDNKQCCKLAHTINQFLKSHALKFRHLVEFKAAQIMYKTYFTSMAIYIKCSWTEKGVIEKFRGYI